MNMRLLFPLLILAGLLSGPGVAVNPIPYDTEDEEWALWEDGEGGVDSDLDSAAHDLPSSGPERPHIIFMLLDDWGWNDVGYHNPQVITPNIDALAYTGVRLEQNYVYAACTPSRASLMTGMDAFHIGRQGNVFTAGSLGGLTLDRQILPQYLKQLGYSTHIVGKWHLGHCNPAYLATNRGFDSQYGIQLSGGYNEAHLHYIDPFPYDFFENDTITRSDRVRVGFQMDLYGDKIVDLIQEQAGLGPGANPMFLYVAFQSTHFPVEAPFEFLSLYPDVDDSEKRRSFLGMTSHMDHIIGQAVGKLKETGLYDNSIIVLMADNGAYSDKWEWLPWYGGGSNLPLRGQKTEAHEGGLRVPALINSPLLSWRQRGRISNKMVHISDWLPTLITAAGGDVEDYPELSDIDGVDQYKALFGRNLGRPRRSFVYNIRRFELPTGFSFYQGAIRYGRWKLLNFNGTRPLMPLGETFQLYDLRDDPYETTDVFAERPEVARRMLDKFFAAAATEVPATGLVPVPDEDQLVIMTNFGELRTDFCDLDGNYEI